MRRPFENILTFLCIIGTLCCVYAPALQMNYVFSDGLYFFSRRIGEYPKYLGFDFVFSIGRFLSAYYLTALSWLVDSLADLRIVRFFSIILLSFCGVFVYKWLDLYTRDKIQSFLVTVMIFVLPSFQVLVSSTGNASFPMAIVLSICAAVFAKQVPSNEGVVRQICHRYTISAVILLFCAFSFYQPLAAFYWVMAALYLLSSHAVPLDEVKRKIKTFFCVGFIAMGMYGLVLKVIQNDQIGLTRGMYNPYRLTSDYIGKLQWFIREPLLNSLNLWNIFPSIHFAKGLFLIICISGIIFCLKTFRRCKTSDERKNVSARVIFNFSVFVILLILSYSINLISTGYAPWYRCAGALTVMILIVSIWSAKTYFSIFPEKLQRSMLSVFLMVSFFIGTSYAHTNVLYHRVLPSYLEMEYVKNVIRGVNLNHYQRIHMIEPMRRPIDARYDEFGVISSHNLPNWKLLVISVSRELGVEEALYRDDLIASSSRLNTRITFSEPTLVIDMALFLEILDKFQGASCFLHN